MTKPILDLTLYPHIHDCVIKHAPHEVLLNLRLVSSGSQKAADAELFRHVIFHRDSGDSRRHYLTMFSPSGSENRLPIPPATQEYVSGAGFKPLVIPAHKGWAHTKVLDTDMPLNLENENIFPALEIVRRLGRLAKAPPAQTYVDKIRMEIDTSGETVLEIGPTSDRMTKHVLCVRYKPDDEGIAYDTGSDVSLQRNDNATGVLIFRPVGEPAVRFCDGYWDDEEAADLYEEYVEQCEEEGTPYGKTLLFPFLQLVGRRLHNTYTLVGLEEFPPAVLARELDVDPEDVTARAEAGGDTWVAFLREHVFEHIRDLPRDDEDDAREVEEVVEILTAEEYRSRLGEYAWLKETCGDEPLVDGIAAW